MSPTTAANSFPGRTDSRRNRSRARLRATVSTQPPGLSGTPSRGHARNASAKASWTASSATVRSPDHRASAATAGPHSRRKTPSRLTIRGLEPRHSGQLADLDGGGGNHRREFDGVVAVSGRQQIEPGGDLGGLRERPVGEQYLAIADPHGGRRR